MKAVKVNVNNINKKTLNFGMFFPSLFEQEVENEHAMDSKKLTL